MTQAGRTPTFSEGWLECSLTLRLPATTVISTTPFTTMMTPTELGSLERIP
jgi:hypothetical protein